MGLSDFDGQTLGGILLALGTAYFIDRIFYDLSKDSLSNSRDIFNFAEENNKLINKLSSKNELTEYENNFLDGLRERDIERYNSVIETSIPKWLAFSRPIFYFNSRKELSELKDKSRERINYLLEI